MKHVFIIDPNTFSGQQWRMDGLLDSIGQHFRTQAMPDFTTAISKFPREALGIIQRQVDEADGEAMRIYAVGGNEILIDCLNGIVGLPKIELGAMPYRGVNTFILSFGEGKAESFKNISSITTAPTISTDVIKAGNNYALSGCAVGFTAAVAIKVRETESAKSARGLKRFVAGLRRFFTSCSFLFDKTVVACHYKIMIDNEDYSGHYSLVSVVNAPYFGRKKTPLAEASPNDSFLDVVLFKSVAMLPTLIGFQGYYRGKMPSHCVRVRAKRIEISSDKPMWIQTDSEHLVDTSIDFEVIPGAVQIVAVDNLTYQEC